MKVVTAKSAGFCFGVQRAVDQVYRLAEEKKGNICTLGPIIHNEEVIWDLEQKGVRVISEEEIPSLQDTTVIIRSHGVGKAVYDLLEENHYLPDLSAIPEELARKTKAMVVSYPLNPVCKTAPRSFYEELVRFAKRYNIIIIHDNAYSEIVYDGREGGSFLSVPGAKEVGNEFNSLSKSYCLTGARISFVMGNRQIVQKFKTLRSQIDYGIFRPVQLAGIAALNGPQDGVEWRRAEYQRRRDALCGGFRSVGWDVPDSEGSMFAWAPLPKGFTDSFRFCTELLEQTGLLCTPGVAFGSLGEGHVRFALVLPVEEIEKIVAAVDASGIIRK